MSQLRHLLGFTLATLFLWPSQATYGQGRTSEIVTAANKFLATLTPEQKQKVLYAFDDAQQRTRWSNFPTGFVPRGGINLKQMNAAQREAAMKLLSVVLSPMGLEKVNEIREADDDFKMNGSKAGPGGAVRVDLVVRLPGARTVLLRRLVI